MPNSDINKTYMQMAKLWSKNSYAKRKKTACLIVKNNQIIADGYNGTPNNFDNICEIKINNKYITKQEVLHAESNAIAKLANSTQSSAGSTLYTTLSPCLECAKLIIQAKIKYVYYAEEYRNPIGLTILNRAGIKTKYVEIKEKNAK
tara:strand:+ start:3362 stop:3802 length:441 start_codon:yes stop_codon:yes gene_type:complete